MWSNSLFEDNAEFGLGMRNTVNKMASQAAELLEAAAAEKIITKKTVKEILTGSQKTQDEIEAQRDRIAALKETLAGSGSVIAKRLANVADYLVKKSVWIIGGDGWAYDIGYGGLDHVLASGENVNVLILDTEVYSNTGGQMSKSTPRSATAQFAAGGKKMPKKDIGMIFSTYGNVYVAKVSMGANPTQAVKAFAEAEAYDGPSLIIAYAHCINHGLNLAMGLDQQKKAVACGHWPLYRYNPALEDVGKNPLHIGRSSNNLDSTPPPQGGSPPPALSSPGTASRACILGTRAPVLVCWLLGPSTLLPPCVAPFAAAASESRLLSAPT